MQCGEGRDDGHVRSLPFPGGAESNGKRDGGRPTSAARSVNPVPSEAKYDIALFGATGFTGRLTAYYLAANAPAGLRWALVGRGLQKLETTARELAAAHPEAPAPALVQADAQDSKGLKDLAESARVVASTVGPYIFHGGPLVAACAAAGTNYCDITGEPEFVDRTWRLHHAEAERSGARLVHCCGYDSIPHDFGAYFTVAQLPEGVPLALNGYMRVGSTGVLSGGSYQTAITMLSRARSTAAEAKRRRAAEAPPAGRSIKPAKRALRRQPTLGGWSVPLPTIDGVIVLRSAAALERYGPDFSYGHHLVAKRLSPVVAAGAAVATMAAMAAIPPTRRLLLKLKAAGEGPSQEVRDRNWYKVVFVGEGGGKRVVTEVAGGDPATTETSKMLGESALCLAFDELPRTAGQLTPVACMGDVLLQRLQRAGTTFRIVEGPRP